MPRKNTEVLIKENEKEKNHTPKERKDYPKYVISCFEWVESLTMAAIAVVLIFTFLFRVVAVDGASMEPTLQSGDRLIVSSLLYRPEPGDVIVLKRTLGLEKPIVKRVIAVAGQEVDIDYETGNVYVDGELLDESAYTENGTTFRPLIEGDVLEFPQTVPEGHLFVLGDNREVSEDSRCATVGMVDERYLLGEAVAVVFPIERMKGLL